MDGGLLSGTHVRDAFFKHLQFHGERRKFILIELSGLVKVMGQRMLTFELLKAR